MDAANAKQQQEAQREPNNQIVEENQMQREAAANIQWDAANANQQQEAQRQLNNQIVEKNQMQIEAANRQQEEEIQQQDHLSTLGSEARTEHGPPNFWDEVEDYHEYIRRSNSAFSGSSLLCMLLVFLIEKLNKIPNPLSSFLGE